MFGTGCFGTGYGGYASGGFYGWAPFMMIPMALLLGIIIYIVYRVFNNRNAECQSSSTSAMDILSERFARGEINEEEYITKKTQLRR